MKPRTLIRLAIVLRWECGYMTAEEALLTWSVMFPEDTNSMHTPLDNIERIAGQVKHEAYLDLFAKS